MSKEVVALTTEATIKEAMETLNKKRIRHIPIVDDKMHVIGIVTDRDIRDASPSIFHAEEHKEDLLKSVSEIMTTNVITAHPLDFVEEVAVIFYEKNIGCLPIVEEQKLVGILTETDVLYRLVELTGAHQPSSQIQVKVENITGKLAEVASVFKEKNIGITSVLVYPCKDQDYKILAFRIQTMDPRNVIQAIENKGYTVLWPNMPGVDL